MWLCVVFLRRSCRPVTEGNVSAGRRREFDSKMSVFIQCSRVVLIVSHISGNRELLRLQLQLYSARLNFFFLSNKS